MNQKSNLFNNISPQRLSWVSTSSGIIGVVYSFVISKSMPRIELYIDTGDKEQNKCIYDFLKERKYEIEEKFGNPLIWQRKDNKRLCRIKYETTANGFDREQWDYIAEFMVESMVLFNKALKGYLEEVKLLLTKENI